MYGPTLLQKTTARLRVLLVIMAGLSAGLAVGMLTKIWYIAPLAAWDVSAAAYITWVWLAIYKLNSAQTAALATYEDPTRASAGTILISASVASLIGVGLLFVNIHDTDTTLRSLQIGLAAASIIFSWAAIHTLFTLRYARLYYNPPKGGVDFGDGDPDYRDFAYIALTIGMTFQVSDTNLRTKYLRRTALRHAMLSYLFGTVFVATTINLIAGLVK